MKRVFNLLIRVLGIFFLVIISAILLNNLVFKINTPEKFKDSNWQGKWQSGGISIIGGKIKANLPDTLPKNEEFEVPIILYYNIWGLYQMGSIKEFTLKAMLTDENYGSGGNDATGKTESFLRPSKIFKAKVITIGEQKIDYQGYMSYGDVMILGGYKSANPYDLGTFKLEKIK